ncbi:MAG: NUDIX domain-containing protein [Parcubacteria group bacterium]|nr:NUDIX domain-containing protein [Parcubacteria group bacterium]
MQEKTVPAQRFCSLFIPYLKKDDKVLIFLQKRSKDAKRIPGFFGFWGGGFEGDENPEQALIREVKEELDYVPVDLHYFREYNFSRSKKFVFCSQVDGSFEKQIKILEGDYGKFFNKSEALNEKKIIEEDKIILKDLFDKL